jgi:hypothetical protein
MELLLMKNYFSTVSARLSSVVNLLRFLHMTSMSPESPSNVFTVTVEIINYSNLASLPRDCFSDMRAMKPAPPVTILFQTVSFDFVCVR